MLVTEALTDFLAKEAGLQLRRGGRRHRKWKRHEASMSLASTLRISAAKRTKLHEIAQIYVYMYIYIIRIFHLHWQGVEILTPEIS